MNYCESPLEQLITTLQALALPAEALVAYMPEDTDPGVLRTELKHWCTVLVGRDDWHPTEVQQTALQQVVDACAHVESVPIPWKQPPSPEERTAYAEARLSTLHRPGWAAVRQASRAVLATYQWTEIPSKPRYDAAYIRFMDFTADLPLSMRLRQSIIDLEHTRVRPGMFYAYETVEHTVAYLWGFQRAVDLLLAPLSLAREEKAAVLRARGWTVTSVGPQHFMLDRGWSSEAIIDELICIEIDKIGLLLEKVGAE